MIHYKYTIYSKSNRSKESVYWFWRNNDQEITDKDDDESLQNLLNLMVDGADLICEQTDSEDDGE